MFLEFGFIVLSFGIVGVGGMATRSWRFVAFGSLWMAFTATLAVCGFLSDFSTTPPRLLMLLAPSLVGTMILAFSSVGTRLRDLSFNCLVGFQAFRIIVEALIHLGVEEGIAPIQMSWTGMNYDIVTGISALLLAPVATRIPKWVIWVWNCIGLALLVVVVIVAALSVPGPLQQIKPDNTWIAYFPFVWLPTVAVVSALLVHIVIFRKLAMERSA